MVSAALMWLFGFAGAVLAREPVLATSVPNFEIPTWVDRQIDEAYARFAGWRGTDVVVVFPLVTDIHAARPRFANPPDFRDTKYHVLFAQRAALKFKADLFAELGDIGFDRDLKWKPSLKDDARQRLESQQDLYRDFPLPVLFCMGNHDSGRANGTSFSELRLSPKDYGRMFNGMIKRRGTALITGPNEDYGYYDVPGKRCRVFFLNTSEFHEAGYTPEQMQFLADHLQMPPRSCAVILGHRCIQPTIGKWKSSAPGTIRNGDLCIKILADFVQGSQGQMRNVRWDFRGNQAATLAGCISGDSHFNNQAIDRGVHFVITQGYGTVSAKELPENVDYVTPVDRTRTMLVDIVALKPARREMKFFRIGAGGPARDRAFKF
jgi:hypothetical protein